MFADIGYGLTTFGYLVLFLLLLTGRTKAVIKYLLILVSVVSMVWALSHISFFAWQKDYLPLMFFDAIRQSAWVLFACACLRHDYRNIQQVLSRPITLVFLLLPLTAIIASLVLWLPTTWQYALHTLIALQILILLELLYRQAGEHKWAYKPLILYLGVLSVFDFITYANATMINQVGDSYLQARGYLHLLLLPFLVLAIRRVQHWDVTIFVSRDIVLHSTLLLVAGAYLFVMALIGYAVRYFGGSWDYSLQLIVAVSSLVLLASLFLSTQLRSRILVFITKHFYANQFDYRVEWVKLTSHLTDNEQSLAYVYHQALTGMLQAVDYEHGILLKLGNRQSKVVASQDALASADDFERQIDALSAYFTAKDWIVDVDELRVKPHVYPELSYKDSLMQGFSYQLVVPIFHQEQLWGMVLMQPKNTQQQSLNWELRDYINAVTAQVSTYILQHESAQALAENAQFAAFNRMSAFVLHDLKNVLAQIDLILANAQQHKHNPEFIEDTFETLEHTKARMDQMLKQLTQKKLDEVHTQKSVDVQALIHELVAQKCQNLRPLPKIHAQQPYYMKIDAEKFSNVMYHLINNAQQATPDNGEVTIIFSQDIKDSLQIDIVDSGEGMSQAFIEERLFKPFDTTKGNAGMGIGAYDAKNYIEELGGNIQVRSELSKGTTFTLTLPVGT